MKETLIFLRTKNRYSQNALAKELGISRQAYIKYETDEVEPPIEILRKLSKIFNVSYKTLIDNELKETVTQNDSAIYKSNHTDNLYAAETAPSYGIAVKTEKTNLLQQIQTKLNNLSKDQLTSVLTIIQSINQLNLSQNTKQTSTSIKKRTPGGLSGSLWMSEDFDAPLDDFKEYM